MMKFIAVIKRRSDLTHEQFREYYENNHMPLVESHIGNIATIHSRNYVEMAISNMPQGKQHTGDDWSGGCDCIMEISVNNRESLDLLFAKFGDPDIQDIFVNDEKNFVDRDFSRIFICETISTYF